MTGMTSHRRTVSSGGVLALAVMASVLLGNLVAPPPCRASGKQALWIPEPDLPRPLRNALRSYLASQAELISANRYAREAQRLGLRPATPSTVLRVGRTWGVDLVVVGSWNRRGRRLTLTFLHGRTGRVLGQSQHRLRRPRLTDEVRESIADALRQAPNVPAQRRSRGSRDASGGDVAPIELEPVAVTSDVEHEEDDANDEEADSRTADGLPEPVNWDDEDEDTGVAEDEGEEDSEDGDGEDDEGEDPAYADEEGDGNGSSPYRLIRFSATVGVGYGMRSVDVPTENGPASLSALPFPAVHGMLRMALQPFDTSSLTVGASVLYGSSIGLRTEDIGSDGSSRTVGARVERLAPQAELGLLLADGDWQPHMLLALGWGFRMFSAGTPISVPEFGLSGPYVSGRFTLPFGESPIALSVTPEVGLVVLVSEELANTSQTGLGFAVGGNVGIQWTLFDVLILEFSYRESHALIGSDLGDQVTDVERWGVLRATYTP